MTNKESPYIPPDTLQEMTRFFMQTSIPRLIEKMKREREEIKC